MIDRATLVPTTYSTGEIKARIAALFADRPTVAPPQSTPAPDGDT